MTMPIGSLYVRYSTVLGMHSSFLSLDQNVTGHGTQSTAPEGIKLEVKDRKIKKMLKKTWWLLKRLHPCLKFTNFLRFINLVQTNKNTTCNVSKYSNVV